MRIAARTVWVPTIPRLAPRYVVMPILIGVVGLLTAYPIGLLVVRSFQTNRPGLPVRWGLDGWIAAYSEPGILKSLLNTFLIAGIRVPLAIAIAIFFVWICTRTNMPMRGLIDFLMWVGFFAPNLPLVMGWILLMDPYYGLLNAAAKQLPFVQSSPLDAYSYQGIIWVHLANSVCAYYFLLSAFFRNVDGSLEEAAIASGCSPLGVLRRITLPLLLPGILAVTALAFIRALESFETDLILGVPAGIYVYSSKVYSFLHWEPAQYAPATALSTLFLVVIFVLILLQRRLIGNRQYTTIGGKGYAARLVDLGRWRFPLLTLCLGWVTVTTLLPLALLTVGTFMSKYGFFTIVDPWTTSHWREAFNDPLFMTSLRNSLVMGIGAALLATAFFALIGYVISRTSLPGRGLLDGLSWLPWSMPGVLLSLAILWLLLGTGPGLRAIYGTVFALMLAMLISQLPLGTQIMKAASVQVAKELEESARMSGASWLYTFRRVMIPLLAPAIVTIGVIVFMASLQATGPVALLATTESRTLAVLMLEYMVSGDFERASVMGVFLTSIILVMAFLAHRYGLSVGPARSG